MAEVSDLCRKFIDRANAKDWAKAVEHLNGLNMYEMLRSVKALDPKDDVKDLQAALTKAGDKVDGARMGYALSVISDKKVPATAPGDLEKSGQVKDAAAFVKAKLPSILTELIPKAKIKGYNGGLKSAGNAHMQEILGAPRADYAKDCQPITNADLKKRIVTKDVGPFKVSGLDDAVASLTKVMASIKKDQRLVYNVLGTAGMLCARFVRGSTTSISNHSWGTAIDLTIAGHLDERGNDLIQFGLHLIAPNFNAEGWYWGAGFKTEDAMHFECGEALVKGFKK